MALPDVLKTNLRIPVVGSPLFIISHPPLVIEQCKADQADLKLNKHEILAKSLAKSNAIQAGRKLSNQEMRSLIDELFACQTPYLSPAGHHTFVTFELEELARQFQRPQ